MQLLKKAPGNPWLSILPHPYYDMQLLPLLWPNKKKHNLSAIQKRITTPFSSWRKFNFWLNVVGQKPDSSILDENVVTLLYLADRRHLALKVPNCVRFQSAGSVSVAKIRPTSTYISRGTCSKHITVENRMVMYLVKICTVYSLCARWRLCL